MVSLVLTVLHVSRIWQELHDIKRKNAALQMQHFVGEEENELLEYLRSLQPEKVLMIRNSSSVKWVPIFHNMNMNKNMNKLVISHFTIYSLTINKIC